MSDVEVARLLNKVLMKLRKTYDSPADETGLNQYVSGVACIYVNNEPKFWFFNKTELIEWMEKVNKSTK